MKPTTYIVSPMSRPVMRGDFLTIDDPFPPKELNWWRRLRLRWWFWRMLRRHKGTNVIVVKAVHSWGDTTSAILGKEFL